MYLTLILRNFKYCLLLVKSFFKLLRRGERNRSGSRLIISSVSVTKMGQGRWHKWHCLSSSLRFGMSMSPYSAFYLVMTFFCKLFIKRVSIIDVLFSPLFLANGLILLLFFLFLDYFLSSITLMLLPLALPWSGLMGLVSCLDPFPFIASFFKGSLVWFNSSVYALLAC